MYLTSITGRQNPFHRYRYPAKHAASFRHSVFTRTNKNASFKIHDLSPEYSDNLISSSFLLLITHPPSSQSPQGPGNTPEASEPLTLLTLLFDGMPSLLANLGIDFKLFFVLRILVEPNYSVSRNRKCTMECSS